MIEETDKISSLVLNFLIEMCLYTLAGNVSFFLREREAAICQVISSVAMDDIIIAADDRNDRNGLNLFLTT
jgi:hypothetical protein